MSIYHISGPVGSRFERVRLRLCAYTPLHYDEQDKLKVVIQVIDQECLIAEDPISIEYLPQEDLTEFLNCSTIQGWSIKIDPTEASLVEHREKVRVQAAKYQREKSHGANRTSSTAR